MEIAPSVSWKRFQFVNLLDVDLKDSSVMLDIAFSDSILVKTSELAAKVDAIAAVNGNFFHTEEGGSVCFFKYKNEVRDTSRTDLDGRLFLPWLDNGAIAVDKKNQPVLLKKPIGGWNSDSLHSTILSAGPVLIFGGKRMRFVRHSFNLTKYSRTGIGITNDQHLLLVVVDGNSDSSAGMTMKQFALLFKKLNCRTALNLDGGGSSTMWIRGQPDSGVVNHPTDNRRFDHYGERRVANSVVLKVRR